MHETRTLTTKEKLYLQDALEMENLCITKYNVYADQCQDEEIKSLMFAISKNKRHHADVIKQITTQSARRYQ